jgi:hypothetical protein
MAKRKLKLYNGVFVTLRGKIVASLPDHCVEAFMCDNKVDGSKYEV